MTDREMCEKHEECRQAFISGLEEAHSHEKVGQNAHARFALLRANAAVAQGLVWAELIGIDPAGWFSRIGDIERSWERVAR